VVFKYWTDYVESTRVAMITLTYAVS